LTTKSIGSLDVGQWVLAENPLGEQDLEFGVDVDPASWKLLILRAPKTDGSTASIRMLRPDWWLAENEAHVDGTVYVSVPECGIDGHAHIVAIKACPGLLPRPGPEFRVVTAVFRHENARILDLRVEGLAGTIGTTPNHPFWSEDRQEFVRADKLKQGETLRTPTGTAKVQSLTERPFRDTVFNLEVQVDHVYHVSSTGVLVHNGRAGDLCGIPISHQRGMKGEADLLKTVRGIDGEVILRARLLIRIIC
jgi:hypothetical protein